MKRVLIAKTVHYFVKQLPLQLFQKLMKIIKHSLSVDHFTSDKKDLSIDSTEFHETHDCYQPQR